MAVRKLGQILVDLGSINDDQLEMLVEEQSQSSGSVSYTHLTLPTILLV